MSKFSISHPLIELEIKLEKIKNLHRHEEIVPERLEKLKKQIEADGCIKNPIIVDEETLIVLDGNHRIVAVEELGCHLIPICLVNYENQHILLDCWYRVIKPLNLEKLISSVKNFKFKVKPSNLKEALQLVNNREAITAISSQTGTYVVYDSKIDVNEIYRAIYQIEIVLRSDGFIVDYDTPVDAQKKTSLKKDLAILLTPIVLKQEVKKETLNRNIFPPKATRHILPATPLFVNASLGWLCDKVDYEERNKTFTESLSKRHLSLVSKGDGCDFYVFK